MTGTGNIQQRVWEAIPAPPLSISTQSLYSLLPYDHRTITLAIGRLRDLDLIELVDGQRSTYRRVGKSARPGDGRDGRNLPHG